MTTNKQIKAVYDKLYNCDVIGLGKFDYDGFEILHPHECELIREVLQNAINPWNYNMDEAPKDGTVVVLWLDKMTLEAHWENSFMNDNEETCGGWVAESEFDYPESWSDGCCWGSNADMNESSQPIGWRYK